MNPVASYVSFNGSSSYGEIPLSALAGATTFTIEVTFATNSTKSKSTYYRWATIVGREIAGNNQNDFGLCVNNGCLCFWAAPRTGGSSATRETVSNATVNDGAIHRAAVVADNGNIYLFCDDRLVASKSSVNAKISDSEQIYIGHNDDSNSYLQMDLYELRLWNIARNQDELFAKIQGDEAGLRAWYIPTGTFPLVDKSANGFNADLHNISTYAELSTLQFERNAQINRYVKNIVSQDADIAIEDFLLADIVRDVSQPISDLADIQLDVKNKFFLADVLRDVCITFDFYADAAIYDTIPLSESADISRTVIQAVVVPAIDNHFNHYLDSITLYRGKPQRFLLPRQSIANITTTTQGRVKFYSNADNNGLHCGENFFSPESFSASLDLCQTVFAVIDETPAPQQVIQAFMQSLNESAISSGTNALNNAINFATDGLFPDKDELVEQLFDDLYNSDSGVDFLRDYCNIILGNTDTGAIIGSDSGGGSTKSRYSIVQEDLSVDQWVTPLPGSSSTIDGLTVHFPVVGADGESFTQQEFHILAGLNSQWIHLALALIKKSFGIDFNTAGATVSDIDIEFVHSSSNNWLAYCSWNISSGNATALTMTVNMYYYDGIDTASVDGRTSVYTYLDRTIAHELTHAVMAANIRYFSNLPKFIREGAAELVHGIDDERRSIINDLVSSRSADLENILDGTVEGDSNDPYAAGYIFFRYLAKQGQSQLGRFAPYSLTLSNIRVYDTDYFSVIDNDVSRSLFSTAPISFDVALYDIVHTFACADIRRDIPATINSFPVDTSSFLSSDASVPATLPAIDDLPIQSSTAAGLQSFEVRINEQQLIPQISFAATQELDIEQVVSGQFLDCPYTVRIESSRKQGVITSYECCSDLDELLYTQITPPESESQSDWGDDDDDDDDDVEYFSANEILSRLADFLQLQVVSHITNYDTSWQKLKDQNDNVVDVLQNFINSTYADIIRDVFSWSSRIPTFLFNVFLQDGMLFAIQRGNEPFTIDITNSKHTQPIITRELVRTVWSSSPNNRTEVRNVFSGDYPQDNDDEPPFVNVHDHSSGIDWVADTVYSYSPLVKVWDEQKKEIVTKGGQLIQVETTKTYTIDIFSAAEQDKFDSFTQISHEYDDDGTRIGSDTYVHYFPIPLYHKSPPPDTESVNRQHYITLDNGEKFLASEYSAQYEGDKLVDESSISHSPSRLGQSHSIKMTTTTIEGEFTGQNTGDDRVTPYRQSHAAVSSSSSNTSQQSRTISGWTLFDTSFPVSDESLLEQITAEIKSLNRSVKETVSLTIYNFPHLINLQDKILFNGAEYFLISNSARSTSRIKSQQDIIFARWIKR